MRCVLATLLGAASAGATGFVLAPHNIPAIIALAIFGAVWACGLAAAGAYSFAPLSLVGLVLDLSWSLLNTLVAVLWLALCAMRGTLVAPTPKSQRSGTIVFSGAALPGTGATTLGNVIGGEWYVHEEVHVWQARIFGPFYWFVYLSSYVANLVVLIVTFRFSDLHWSAYGRDVMEDWAELACPVRRDLSGDGHINWGWWFIGLLCASFYAVCLLLMGGAVPWVRNWLPHIGLSYGAMVGLAGIVVFAVIRSLLPRSDPNAPAAAAPAVA